MLPISASYGNIKLGYCKRPNSMREGELVAGQIYNMIQQIISQRAKGNVVIANSVRTKMYLKGIAVDKYTAISPDDTVTIQKVREVAKEFGIFL